MRATIGRIVHYVSHGTPVREDGTQTFLATCRAAVVTATPGPAVATLCVLNPTGLFFHDAAYGEQHEPGSWHWPELVEENE